LIAVDTSALMAVILDEPSAEACIEALTGSGELMISAATIAEALIVAERRGAGDSMARLIDQLGFTIVDATHATARRVAQTYAQWGKGQHPAGLNFGDCFAYDVAKQHECPLLFVGDDFSRTDIKSALQSAGG
jgi:ribonuclease VapC